VKSQSHWTLRSWLGDGGATQIQAMSQSIAELKEKVKILVNEVEILRSEVVVKAKLLVKAQADHAAAVVDRNYLQVQPRPLGDVVERGCTPPVNGNTVRSFSTHGQQSAAKGSSTTVLRSDIRLIQYLDSSAHGLVRRWRLIGHFPIH
jgi:hypothetical protein